MHVRIVGGELFEVEDALYDKFEALADTPDGPVADKAVQKMRDVCQNDPQRLQLIRWLCLWRGMSPKEASNVIQGCRLRAEVQRVVKAFSKMRYRYAVQAKVV